jgi:hypothetical protein
MLKTPRIIRQVLEVNHELEQWIFWRKYELFRSGIALPNLSSNAVINAGMNARDGKIPVDAITHIADATVMIRISLPRIEYPG